MPIGSWLPTDPPLWHYLMLNWAVRVQELDLISAVSRILLLLCQEIIRISWSTHSFTWTKLKETDKNLILTMNLYIVKHDNWMDWISTLPICLFSLCGHIHIESLILIRRFLSKLGGKGMVFCVLLDNGQSSTTAKGDQEEAQENKVYSIHRS